MIVGERGRRLIRRVALVCLAALQGACGSGSDEDSPYLVGRAGLAGYSRYLTVEGSRAYVGDPQLNRLYAVNVSNPGKPSLAGQIELSSLSAGLDAAGSRVFAGNFHNLLILDASNAAAMTPVGQIPTSGGVSGVVVLGTTAYVTVQTQGLRIFEVSDPAQPVLLGSLGTSSVAHDLALSNGIAYVANGSEFVIVDVSDPANPQTLGTLTMPALTSAYDVAVVGTTAYVACLSEGARIIDISDPSAPVIVGSFPSVDNALGVAAGNGRLYLADAAGGLAVVDTSNPANPVLKHRIAVDGEALQVIVIDGKAYVASGTGGLQIFDVTNL